MSALAPSELPGWPAALHEALAAAYVGISPATLRRLSDKGDAPKPLQLSPGRVAWRRADLDAWLDAKAGLIPASSGKSAWDG